MEYSREVSKADEANPSEAVLGIWACNVPVREHQALAVLSCNVLVREHQVGRSGLKCPRSEHQASGSRCETGPTVSRAVSPSLNGEKNRQKLLLTAPEGAGGF